MTEYNMKELTCEIEQYIVDHTDGCYYPSRGSVLREIKAGKNQVFNIIKKYLDKSEYESED